LGLSAYVQRYLTEKITHRRSVLQHSGYLLAWALSGHGTRVEDAVLADYGGGTGILSFLARESGVGTLVYNDIYDLTCRDVRLVAQALELPLQHVVCGDIDALVTYLGDHALSLDAIVSAEVIEHVYDIEAFLAKHARLGGRALRVVHATGANAANPLIHRRIRRIHRQAEFTGRSKEWGWKERDANESFLACRRRIVAEHAGALRPEDVDQLAAATRGLRQDDILRVVEQFRRDGRISYRPAHPTNTCDPYTGNWAERLMDPAELVQILRRAGFRAEMRIGYWGCSGPAYRRLAAYVLNAFLRLTGRRALWAAPYYVLLADSARPEQQAMP
jgi:hypothetical protein